MTKRFEKLQTSAPAEDARARTLRDEELAAVAGGVNSLSSSLSQIIKNFGGALQTAARGG